MNNVVSYEMAVKLMDSGFPQMDGDETWEDGLYWCTWGDDEKEISLFRGGEVDEFGHGIVAYAPCATELLPINWAMVRYRNEWMVLSEHSIVTWESFGYEDIRFVNDDNPAEAAAEAWLYVNQNNQQ